MAKHSTRRRLYVISPDATTAVPAKVDWLHDETLKTRLAHGFCSRDPIAGPCASANICEQCDNFVPDPNRADILKDQLADIHILRDDATTQAWTDEAVHHEDMPSITSVPPDKVSLTPRADVTTIGSTTAGIGADDVLRIECSTPAGRL